MAMVKLTLKDLEDGTENYFKALSNATTQYFRDWVNMDIEINKILKITSIDGKNCDLSIDLPFEEGYLLSFATDLDYVCYDCTTELWNNIVLDDKLMSEYNRTDVYTESLLFLFGKIEDEIMGLELNTAMDLTKKIDVQSFINDYEYKELINEDYLKEAIVKSLKELQELIEDNVKNYFESEEYFELIDDIEWNEINYMYEEIQKNGFIEVYL